MSENTTIGARDRATYELGTEDRPYPMMHNRINGQGRVEPVLGVLDEGALRIDSERSEDEVLGMAFRDMPSPGMLRLFLEGCSQRESDDPRKVEFMMGDPGAGKSFLAKLHANMRVAKGAIMVDCGGRDLSELLYETVLDYQGGKSLYEEIDQKLADGSMSPASIRLLQNVLDSAMSTDGMVHSIDWQSIAHEKLETAVDAIRKVADMEGLGKGGDVSIGLTTKEGPIIRAWRENRPLILDEYNKAKPGTDDALQILWQVFNGEMKTHTIKGGGGKTFTFHRDEMPDHFFVTLTGNLTKDGYSTRSLSSSAYQRLQPKYIPAPSVDDLQHRICQKLTGMPVSTIYHANEEYWQAHKGEFTDYLIDLRKKGLSEEQQANIPSWQFSMLKNWENVLDASRQLAVFYDRWMQAIDLNSPLHGDGTELAALQDEIDESYAAEVGVGLRRMMRHVDQATIIKPEARLGSGIRQRGERSGNEADPIEKEFGTRLSRTILEDLNATAEGREKLLDWLLAQAAEAGLFYKVMQEGRSTRDHLIENKLNIDPEKLREIPENIAEVHALLCEHLRAQVGDAMELSDDDAALISPSALEHVLAELNGQKDVERLTSRSGQLMLPNDDLDTLTEQPLAPAVGLETNQPKAPTGKADEEARQRFDRIREEESGLEDAIALPTEDLVDSERFLISLAVSSLKKNNLQATFTESSFTTASLAAEDVAFAALNNTAPNGLAVNMLACKSTGPGGQERDEFLYVVHDRFGNDGDGNTLVTGTARVSERLKDALAKNGVTYVNRNDADAGERISAALEGLTEGKSVPEGCEMGVDHILTAALLFRNPQYSIGPDGNKQFLYELPHQDRLYSDAPVRQTTEVKAQHRENLVSLLADEGQYLDSTVGKKRPFLLTNSPDIDKLRHTLRHLTQDEPKHAGMNK